MYQLSITKPNNEKIVNPKDHDSMWSLFSKSFENFPKNFKVPMIINGKEIFGTKVLENKNPSTGEIIGSYTQADETHAELAVKAALEAKKDWASLSPASRLQKFRDLEIVLEKWKYDIMAAEMVECGYIALEAYVEWAELIDFVKFNNYYYAQLLNEQLGDGWNETNQLHMRPLKGFTCAVTPFNFPVAIGYHLPLVMALTGNTVVWKPSDDANFTSYLLMKALEDVGFPKGVINMITGDGKPCLPYILKHPELTALNFTGSFATARAFGNYLFNSEFSRKNFPRFVAETGGKDFMVVDSDIDVKETARLILQGAFGRSGQKCSANSVVLVNEKIWAELKEELIKETKKLNVTNVTERNSSLGAVINERQFDKIIGYIERAKKDSQCNVIVGGTADKKNGYYIQPTFIEVKTDKHYLLAEEVFGPLTAIRTFKNIDDVFPIIEQHDYRLSGSLVSRNEKTLDHYVPKLSQYAGNFYVNRRTTGAIVNMQPFGGDGASGTNHKAGGKWYLLNFISQGTVTRQHVKSTTPESILAELSKK